MPLTVVEITCSRCHLWLEGYQLEDGTAGYVDVRGGRWRRYARPGETHLCDECVCHDPLYQQDFPFAADQMRMAGL